MTSVSPSKPLIVFATPPLHHQATARIEQHLHALHASLTLSNSTIIDCVGATPSEILDQLDMLRGRINVFHYIGSEAQFKHLYETSKHHKVGDLYKFFGQEKGLKLLVLAGCATAPITEALHAAGVGVVLGYKKPFSYAKCILYFSHFYQQLQQGATLSSAHQDARHCIEGHNSEGHNSEGHNRIVPPTLNLVIYLSASDAAGAQIIWYPKRKRVSHHPIKQNDD